MKPLQIALVPLVLAACAMAEAGYAAPAQKAAPKKIVLPVKITACTQYLELAGVQQKTLDRKQAVLDDLTFERNVEISIEGGRNPAFQTSTPEAASAPDSPMAVAASKNSIEIKMMTEELARGSKVVAVLEDAYRRCIANPQALAVSKPPTKAAPVAQKVKAPVKRTVAAPREQNLRAATPPRGGHDPGASAIVGGVIGGAIGGMR